MLKYMSESIVKDISVIIQTRTETYQSDNMGCYHTKRCLMNKNVTKDCLIAYFLFW